MHMGRQKKKKKNRVFEVTMTENLTKLMTNTNPQIPNVKETYINQDKELLKTYVDIVESNCRGLKTRQILKEAVVGTLHRKKDKVTLAFLSEIM